MYKKAFQDPCNECNIKDTCYNNCSHKKTYESNKKYMDLALAFAVAMIACLLFAGLILGV